MFIYGVFGDFEAYLNEELVPEILEKNLPLEEVGIAKSEDGEYQIFALDEVYTPVDFEISKRDLARSLICVEVFGFDQKITDASL